MPSAYSLIPPDRPATEEEALELYKPVVNYFVARVNPSLLRGYDDIRQDALFGVVYAWRTYNPSKGMAFKTWAVAMVRQWAISKGSAFFGFNVFNACKGGYYYDKMAVINPQVSLDEIKDGWDEDRYGFLADPTAEQAFDVSGLSFEQLVGLVSKERDQFCLREYYLAGRTLDDIGKELGISREYVRQRLEHAYAEIKRGLGRKVRIAVPMASHKSPGLPLVPIQQPLAVKPLVLTASVNSMRLAEIAQVSRRTVYRWIKASGKEAVVKVCNDALQEFETLVKPSEMALIFKVSKSTIYRMIVEGKIKTLNLFGDTLRIPISEVRRIWNEGVAQGIAEPRELSDRELKGLFTDAATD
jgi:RNA polymerase sigma factor (sigma-70 family)